MHRLIWTAVLSSLLLLSWSINTHAQGRSKRANTSEFTFHFNYVEDETLEGRNGSFLELDDDLGFGMGFMYNNDEHWAFGGSFDWIELDYRAHAEPENPVDDAFHYNNTLEVYSINFDTIYYFLDKDISPFVSGSLGWTSIDTNVVTGPGYEYCWWDWYGYYCSTVVPTKRKDGFSYKLGAGLRWDVNRSFAIRGSVSMSEIDLNIKGENPEFTIWRLELISRM